jgi:hypothetical protein
VGVRGESPPFPERHHPGNNDISGWIVSGRNLEMGTEHVMDVQITCYGCP